MASARSAMRKEIETADPLLTSFRRMTTATAEIHCPAVHVIESRLGILTLFREVQSGAYEASSHQNRWLESLIGPDHGGNGDVGRRTRG